MNIKQLIAVCIVGTLILSFCGCDDAKNSSADSTELTTPTTTSATTTEVTTTAEVTTAPATTTTAPQTEPEFPVTVDLKEFEKNFKLIPSPNSEKIISTDKMFSLTYSFSTIHPKVNVPFTVTTVFKNETDNAVKAGFNLDTYKPVYVGFAKLEDCYFRGAGNNFADLNTMISAHQVFKDTQTFTLTEKGTYVFDISANCKRTLLSSENINDFELGMIMGNCVYSQMLIGPYIIKVT